MLPMRDLADLYQIASKFKPLHICALKIHLPKIFLYKKNKNHLGNEHNS
jgi:hypothetical protein